MLKCVLSLVNICFANPGMKYFVISVDTESDWFNKADNDISSIRGVPYLQETCARYGMIPTYLVTYEMAYKQEAVRVIKEYLDRDECEVGAHMHIWSTPPFENPNERGVDEKWIRGIQSEIPGDALDKKMTSLSKIIESNYGASPTSHRAGRWGVDRRTLVWLAEHGYLVDSSICPYVNRVGAKGVNGVIEYNSRHSPNAPYYPDSIDFTREAGPDNNRIDLIEVPATGIKGDIFGQYKFRGTGRLRNFLYKLGYTGVAARPFQPSFDIPMNVFEKMTRRLYESEIQVINMMFHSTELIAGGSPFSKTEEKLSRLKARLETALSLAKEYSIRGIRLSDVYKHFAAKRDSDENAGQS